MTRCIIGIRGQNEHPDYPVDIWFDSLRSVASILSDENRFLLKMISEHQPETLAELAILTGRSSGNLSRTLKTLEKNNLITLCINGKKKKPCLTNSDFLIIIN